MGFQTLVAVALIGSASAICEIKALSAMVIGLPQQARADCAVLMQVVASAAVQQGDGAVGGEANAKALAEVECECFNGIPEDHVEMKAEFAGALDCVLIATSEVTLETRVRQCWAGTHPSQGAPICDAVAISAMISGLPEQSQLDCSALVKASVSLQASLEAAVSGGLAVVGSTAEGKATAQADAEASATAQADAEASAEVECGCFDAIPKDHAEVTAELGGTLDCVLVATGKATAAVTLEDRVRQCWAGTHSSQTESDSESDSESDCDCAALAEEADKILDDLFGGGGNDSSGSGDTEASGFCAEQGAKDCAVDCMLCVRPECGTLNIGTADCPMECAACAKYQECDTGGCSRSRRDSHCMQTCMDAASKDSAAGATVSLAAVLLAAAASLV
jgi:hypothetical protein